MDERRQVQERSTIEGQLVMDELIGRLCICPLGGYMIFWDGSSSISSTIRVCEMVRVRFCERSIMGFLIMGIPKETICVDVL
jgi:hypothetical protein